MQTARIGFSILLAFAASVAPAWAAIHLPAIFGDNMVVQRGCNTPVWGIADPGEQLTVELAGHRVSATADGAGDWRVNLPPLTAGGPYKLTVKGKSTSEFSNVMVGDVWLCAGQSNMGIPIWQLNNPAQIVARADYKNMRFITVPARLSSKPEADMAADWQVVSPATAGELSALAYYFGREIASRLSVPVGLLCLSMGGTPVDAWISRQNLVGRFNYAQQLQKWDDITHDYPEAKRRYAEHLIGWRESLPIWKQFGLRPPKPPMPPQLLSMQGRPAGLFNGMVSPIIPFSIKGVIWCQGEADVGYARRYKVLFPALIQDWRWHWQQGALPFYFLQLHNYLAHVPYPQQHCPLAELREAQKSALTIPHTGMAVAIDLGGSDDSIHYLDKAAAGHRLALAVLAEEYGQKVPPAGPTYMSCRLEDRAMRIFFRNASGLAARGGGPLRGFAVAGSNHKFVWASAQIQGESVLVSSPSVRHPAAVRYAWADNPDCNLVNGADLPAAPFRTDNNW